MERGRGMVFPEAWGRDQHTAAQEAQHEAQQEREEKVAELVDAGHEDRAREIYGDDAVMKVIRDELIAEGWDPDKVFAEGNGYEAPR